VNHESLILGPCVTEKGTAAGETANQVVFRVTRNASKGAIRQSVQSLFKVTVLKVRTANFLGKKRVRGRIAGQRPDWKKAYVTLKKGDRIEFFEGM
jgi:large subunit ribosomal protein L23